MTFQFKKLNNGKFYVRCARCGQESIANHPQQLAATHKCGSLGLGDAVAKMTSAVGIKPCKPCEKRKQMLNGMAQNIWGRK